MNERMKILQMLSEGKISPEQAESLLSTLDGRGDKQRARFRGLDKNALNDLKSLGAQVSTAVTQSLSEVRRAIEGQFDALPFSSQSVSVTHDIKLPLNIQRVMAQTSNGSIQVSTWDEPYVQIHVRARAKTNNLAEAKRALISALQTEEHDENYQLTIAQGDRHGDNHVHIVGAGLDIFIPKVLRELYLRSHNGRIYADSVQLENIRLETTNGSVSLYRSTADRITLTSENGSIEMAQSLGPGTRQVEAATKNGSVNVEAIPESLTLMGQARTIFGRVEITDPRFLVTFEDSIKRNHARFQTSPPPEDESTVAAEPNAETRVRLETRNGFIRVKP